MYVAIDDTDSKSWMCTTFLANELLRSLKNHDLIGHPRLVRLNPAVPWKTRGNGAICLRFGRGGGTKRKVGELDGGNVLAFDRCLRPADMGEVLDAAMKIVSRWSRLSEGASPGVVVSPRKPGAGLYWSAVRRIVAKEEVQRELDDSGAVWGGLSGSRGVVGAAAAMSWRPRDRTFELLAYRERGRWGTERRLDERSVISIDEGFPSTFNNYDYEEGKVAISPNSPCPVLYGIRGEDPGQLIEASERLVSEARSGYLVFLTNQGTDDHIMERWKSMEPNRSYSLRGSILRAPRDIEGGHVVFSIGAREGEVDVTAYEPSKGFRGVVRALAPGDSIRVMGELRDEPRTLNIEKLEVIELADITRKEANPRCPLCGGLMKSAGRNQGYRCRHCGTRSPESSAPRSRVKRGLLPGWYQPPVSARRHLSKPLERM